MLSNIFHRSNLQLWFARVGDHTVNIEQTIQALFSTTEKKRLQATSNINKRREFLLSRALMRHALQQKFGHPEQHWQFIERPNQTPIISNLSNQIYFSLAHSKGAICFALASCPIGIDLENTRQNRDFINLAEAVMNEEEITQLKRQKNNVAENFYRNWCAKEAYYKMLPKEQQSGLSFKELPALALLKNIEEPVLFIKKEGDFMLAIVSQKPNHQITCHAFPSSSKLTAEFAQSFS